MSEKSSQLKFDGAMVPRTAPSPFDIERDGTGTGEWAEFNENIERGCSHDCLYCYAAYNASARFHWRPRAEWKREELTKRAFITAYPKRDGVVMFPSAHDITPGIVDDYIRVAKLILGSGNYLLIVTKPHLECIRKVIEAVADFKEQIMFRFTIGTMDEKVARFWEPGAPMPSERVEALKLAFDSGFRTSISAEPLLGGVGTAAMVLDAVCPFVTHTVWIGKLNKPRLRAGMDDPLVAIEVERIERLQTDAAVLDMHAKLSGNPMVRWKDSVKTVLMKAGRIRSGDA